MAALQNLKIKINATIPIKKNNNVILFSPRIAC